MNSIFELPFNDCLQQIFNYASPVFVGVESIALRGGHSENDCYWYNVLQTTRILLAHCTIMADNQETFVNIVSNNLRNLYRLFDIDLSEKEMWSSVTSDTVYYVEPILGKFWISNEYGAAIASLKTTSFEVMNECFQLEQNKVAQVTFGHCVYKLVATSDTGWTNVMRTKYRLLI